jgi:hypothetical protein
LTSDVQFTYLVLGYFGIRLIESEGFAKIIAAYEGKERKMKGLKAFVQMQRQRPPLDTYSGPEFQTFAKTHVPSELSEVAQSYANYLLDSCDDVDTTLHEVFPEDDEEDEGEPAPVLGEVDHRYDHHQLQQQAANMQPAVRIPRKKWYQKCNLL